MTFDNELVAIWEKSIGMQYFILTVTLSIRTSPIYKAVSKLLLVFWFDGNMEHITLTNNILLRVAINNILLLNLLVFDETNKNVRYSYCSQNSLAG